MNNNTTRNCAASNANGAARRTSTPKPQRDGRASTDDAIAREHAENDAELSVLGSIILDPSRLDEVAGLLTPDDFHLELCRTVYGLMLDMRREGVAIDVKALYHRLVNTGATVTLTDLYEILNSVPTASNVIYYAQIVRGDGERRRATIAAQKMQLLSNDTERMARDPDGWRAEIDAIPGFIRGDRDTGRIDHGWMTFEDFMAQDLSLNYLVQGVVPEAQGGIISGRLKTLKTGIALDLFISMASGAPFLGKFSVPAPVPCALMTTEAGDASIIGTARRIAAVKGIDYRDGPYLTTERAKMTDVRHLDQLKREIDEHGWRCVGIDPTYLAFADVGEFSGNVFLMGRAVEPLSKLIEDTGCSLILLNHNTKGRGKDIGRFDPPDLAEISGSGWAEWMRFWLLLASTREWDEVSGTHWLWMRTGGSAGHADLCSLEIIEGEKDDRDRRTKWEVTIMGADDARRSQTRQRDAAREEREAKRNAAAAEKADAQLDADRRAIVAMLAKMPDGVETKTGIRSRAKVNGRRLDDALDSLRDDGTIVESEITKGNNRKLDAWKLRGDTDE